jgi:hypothetical protein
VVDISSDEEYLIPDTSWDEKFTKKLFSDLNRELLGPVDDGKVIILNDSDEEEEDVADTEATPSSTAKSLAPTVSTIDVDDVLEGVQDSSNDDRTPDRAQGSSSSGGDEARLP